MSVEIKPATSNDAYAIADINMRGWQTAYKNIFPSKFLKGLNVDKSAERWKNNLISPKDNQTFLALKKNKIIGFADIGKSRDERYTDYAELYAIYLDPDYYGQGIGYILFKAAVDYASKNGYSRMFVNVLKNNILGRKFYDSVKGLPILNSEEDLAIFGGKYIEIKYEWSDLKTI